MALRRKSEVFAPTDGVLALCRETPARRARGLDWTGDAGLETVCELPYRRSQVRSQDVDVLGEAAQALTLKVCVRRPPGLSTTDVVVVDGHAYDLTRADEDGRLAWLYLSQLTSACACELIATKTVYDELGLPKSTETCTMVLARTVAHGTAAADPGALGTLSVTVRACDWDDERAVVMAGRRHTVTRVTGDGEWVRLDCSEGVADRGR